jgi:hypothetical protein
VDRQNGWPVGSAEFQAGTGGTVRRVSGKPYFQWVAPTVWTTLTLTIGVDGSAQGEMTGASRFPRHWIYDHHDHLAVKSGVTDLQRWWLTSHRQHTLGATRTPSP